MSLVTSKHIAALRVMYEVVVPDPIGMRRKEALPEIKTAVNASSAGTMNEVVVPTLSIT